MFRNIKNIIIGVLAILILVGGVFAVRAFNENKLLRNNVDNLSRENEKNAIVLEFKDRAFKDFINNKWPQMQETLDSLKIKQRRIEQVVVQKIYYKDSTVKKIDLQPVVDAVKKGVYIKEPFQDKTDCLVISGYVEYNGTKMNIVISDREFKSVNEVVSHWERKKWKLFGFIPTRLFGRKEIKVTVLNSCGESKTVIVNKKK